MQNKFRRLSFYFRAVKKKEAEKLVNLIIFHLRIYGRKTINLLMAIFYLQPEKSRRKKNQKFISNWTYRAVQFNEWDLEASDKPAMTRKIYSK